MSRLPSPVLRDLARDCGLAVRVRGSCMAPGLRDGAVVRVRAGRFRPGDVVLVRRACGGFAIHRLLGTYRWRGERRALTRGDSAPRADGAVPLRDVIGVVARPVPARVRLAAIVRFAGWGLVRALRAAA